MSPRMTHRLHWPAALALLAGAAIAAAGCTRADASRLGSAADAAAKVYVPPGSYDEFYAFMSGGFDGQVGVYGLPSGRLSSGLPACFYLLPPAPNKQASEPAPGRRPTRENGDARKNPLAARPAQGGVPNPWEDGYMHASPA